MTTFARFAPAIFSLCAASALHGAQAATLSVQVTDAGGKPLADVVIVADVAGAKAAAGPLNTVEVGQRGLQFVPLVSVVQTGTRVTFPNYDRVRHHIYSFSPAKKFDQKLYSGAAAATQVFDKAGTVVLGCNIHDRMIAYIKVVDSPLFAKTDAAGVARITVPAAGKYAVSAWHHNMSGPDAQQQVAVADGDKPVAFRLVLKPPPSEAGADAGGM